MMEPTPLHAPHMIQKFPSLTLQESTASRSGGGNSLGYEWDIFFFRFFFENWILGRKPYWEMVD